VPKILVSSKSKNLN